MSKKEKELTTEVNILNPDYKNKNKEKERLNDLDRQEKQKLLQQKKAEKLKDLEERQEYYRKKRSKRALKIAKLRPLKNFGWWFFGFISFIIVFCGGIAATLYFVSVKDVIGNDSSKYVSEEIANKSLLQAGLGITEYTGGDIPAVKELVNILEETFSLNKYMAIDIEKLDDKKIIGGDYFSSFGECIRITATLASVGGADMLGDFSNINAMKNYDLIPSEELPENTDNPYNYKMYYYQKEDGTYAIALNEDYTRVSEAVDKELYYPALQDVVITDLGSIFSDRLNREPVEELFKAFGVKEDSSLQGIFEDMTVGELKDFDANNIKLTAVLSNKVIEIEPSEKRENSKLYSVLLDMTKKNVVDRYMNIHNEENADDIWDYSKALSSFNTLDVAEQNKYITVGCLAGADVTHIHLCNIVENDLGNEKFYNIVIDMTKNNVLKQYTLDYNVITKVEYDSIVYTNGEANEKWAYLRNEAEAYYYGLDNIFTESSRKDSLNETYPTEVDKTAFRENIIKEYILKNYICADMSGRDFILMDSATRTAKENELNNLESEVYNEYRVNAINYYTGLTLQQRKEFVTVSNLDEAEIDNIKLTTVMGTSSPNKILNAVLQKEDVTVSNIGEYVNGLTLSEVYTNVVVFTESLDDAATYSDLEVAKYRKETIDGKDVYTLDLVNGTYYISKQASVWLFMMYDGMEDINEFGFAKKYTANNLTISGMDDSIGNMGSKVSSSSVRQLIASGIISDNTIYSTHFDTHDDTTPTLYAKSMEEVMTRSIG